MTELKDIIFFEVKKHRSTKKPKKVNLCHVYRMKYIDQEMFYKKQKRIREIAQRIDSGK